MPTSQERATDYGERLKAEEKAFTERLVVHDVPDIFHYWSNKYVLPKIQRAGFASLQAMFTDTMAELCSRRSGESARFLSIGSGNCDQELDFAAVLRAAGHSNFVIDCLDLNEAMLERGKENAASRGLADHFNPIRADYNEWQPSRHYDGVIAIQALHHVVNLEGLFVSVKEALLPDGRFMIADMIGRNGHLRWPEALAMIHEYWKQLPPSFRYNHELKRYEELYENWDCSTEGFEGIRAQDILPLLIEMFRFEVFVGFGNLIEPFVARTFGPNFDATREWDRDFIDRVENRNEEEIMRGTIKPTQMLAIVGKNPESVLRTRLAHPVSFYVRDPSETCGDPTPLAAGDLYPWRASPLPAESELRLAIGRLAEAERQAREVVPLRTLLLERQRLFEERTEWALQLQAEVAELRGELEKRTAWAIGLDRHIEELTRRLKALDKERPPENRTAGVRKTLGKLRRIFASG